MSADSFEELTQIVGRIQENHNGKADLAIKDQDIKAGWFAHGKRNSRTQVLCVPHARPSKCCSARYIASPTYEYLTNTSDARSDSSSTPCTAVSMYFESQPM